MKEYRTIAKESRSSRFRREEPSRLPTANSSTLPVNGTTSAARYWGRVTNWFLQIFWTATGIGRAMVVLAC